MAKTNTQHKATKTQEVVEQKEVKAKKADKKVEQVAEPVKVEAPVETKKSKSKTEKVEATPAAEPVAEKSSKKSKKTETVVEAAVEPVAEKSSKKSKKGAAEPVAEEKPAKKGKKAAAEPVAEAEPAAEEGKKSPRYFRCVYATTDGQIVHAGRYSGKKPKQAACKALTAIVKNNGLATGEKVKFLIQECTRGSKKKKYSYVGEQVDLAEPVTVTITKKDGSTSEINYTKNNHVKKIGIAEVGNLADVDLQAHEDAEEEVEQVQVKKTKKAKKETVKAEEKPAKKAKAKKN